jgi:uncharacterized cupredoxin-like copper-binding protein
VKALEMQRFFFLALLAVLGTLLLACAGAVETTEVVVEVSEQGYAPNRVTVTVGQETKLTLRNLDGTEHDLGIREIPIVTRGGSDSMAGHNMPGMSGEMAVPLQLHIVTPPEATNSLEFTPSKLGEYEFQCQIAGHTEAGTLVVVRSAP